MIRWVINWSKENNEQVAVMLAKGISVAVVFGGKVMPETYLSYPVVPGDETDLRHLDPAGCVVGLKLKASYSTNTEGKKRINVPNGKFVVLESRATP